MEIRIYNTLTRRKEPFETVQPNKVGIYLCGPTVYKPSHIGHAVGPVIFDAVKRFLTYRGYAVNWVVNITDVEDKLIAEAASQNMGVYELAEQVTRNYTESLAALNVTGIDHFPKASEHIGEIIDIIQRLIANDAAYAVDGDVYFDVTSDDNYGKLSNRQADDQSAQREVQGGVSGVKRHPGDFALWKAAKPDEPAEVKFPSPWGLGRPGWHIECSAMAMKILGETFDIHGGGLDLIFPHHENEIAQSESCTHKPFAKYWMHNGLTRFNTKKVSKSDPKMQAALREMTLSNLLQRYDGELLRYFILSTHYRRPIEYSPDEIASRKKGLTTFYRLFQRVHTLTGEDAYDAPPIEMSAPAPALETNVDGASPAQSLAESLAEAHERFDGAMSDDFNTASAIAVLFELANAVNRFIEQTHLETDPSEDNKMLALGAARRLVALGRILGLFLSPPARTELGDAQVEKIMRAHLDVRSLCRAEKQFALADRIRDGLALAGIILEDKPSGSAWSCSGEAGADLVDTLMALHVDVRRQAREDKCFAIADAIRDTLKEAGVVLEDKPTGTTWTLDV